MLIGITQGARDQVLTVVSGTNTYMHLNSLTHSLLLTHSLTYLLTHSLTHSLTKVLSVLLKSTTANTVKEPKISFTACRNYGRSCFTRIERT